MQFGANNRVLSGVQNVLESVIDERGFDYC